MWDAAGLVTHLLDAFTTHFKEVFGQSVIEASVHLFMNCTSFDRDTSALLRPLPLPASSW